MREGWMPAVVRTGPSCGQVSLEERPIPQAGPEDVILRVHAAGLCGSDLNIWLGRSSTAQIGVTLGHEFAGEVVQTGERVSRWKLGDRVVSDNTGTVCGECYACARGEYQLCMHRKSLGFQLNGGFAPYVRIPGEGLRVFPNLLMRIPEGASFEEAAVLDPYANACNALITQAGLTVGDTVLVTGAGPLALACIELARAAGAVRILSMVRSATAALHREACLRIGADEVLEADRPGCVERVLELTRGQGVPIAADTAGANGLFPLLIRMVRRGGRLVRIGYDDEPLQTSLVEMTRKNISLIGHMGYDPTAWKRVLTLLEHRRISPSAVITERLPLMEFEKAVRLALSRKAIKVVLYP